MVQTGNYQDSYRTNAVSVCIDQPSYNYVHTVKKYMGWFFSFGTNASVLSCNNVGRCHFYWMLLTYIPSLRAHDLTRPHHRLFAVAPVRWVVGSQRSQKTVALFSKQEQRTWLGGALSPSPHILPTSVPATMISSRRCHCAGSATVPLKTLSRLSSALFAPSIDWAVPTGSNNFRIAGNTYTMVGTTSRAYETWNHLGELFIQL